MNGELILKLAEREWTIGDSAATTGAGVAGTAIGATAGLAAFPGFLNRAHKKMSKSPEGKKLGLKNRGGFLKNIDDIGEHLAASHWSSRPSKALNAAQDLYDTKMLRAGKKGLAAGALLTLAGGIGGVHLATRNIGKD